MEAIERQTLNDVILEVINPDKILDQLYLNGRNVVLQTKLYRLIRCLRI